MNLLSIFRQGDVKIWIGWAFSEIARIAGICVIVWIWNSYCFFTYHWNKTAYMEFKIGVQDCTLMFPRYEAIQLSNCLICGKYEGHTRLSCN
jgi:hypothetical protein